MSFSGTSLFVAYTILLMRGAVTDEELPAWVFPPPGGFTAEDLDRIPHLPPHTELIDGSLVFVSPQTSFHSLATDLLESRLRPQTPKHLRVRRQMTVVLDRHNRPEPDICLVKAAAALESGDETFYRAEGVRLVAEVVSSESAARDRRRKPVLYAEAGIPHFWLVERSETRRPVIHTYALDRVGGRYELTGIFHDHLKLSSPFTIDIDLTEIDKL